MNHTVIKDNLEKAIHVALSDKHNTDKLNHIVKKYIDHNNQILYANAPIERLYFSDVDREHVFNIINIKKEYVNEIIKKVDMIKSSWKIVKNPFNIAMTMIIRQYSIDKKEESLNNALLYLTLALYSSLHYKYFRLFTPNENVMSYTINNLNNKFLFKQYGVVIKALFHTANKTLEKYKKELERGNDMDIVNFLMFLQTRLNNLMKNFTNEYMKNYKNKNFLNTEKDSNDADNYFETDNVSLMISRLTSQTTNKFYSGDLNDKLIRVSSKFSDVSPITLKYALESIKKNEREKVESLIQSILQVYLIDGKNSYESIASQRFIAYCISIYSKSNTKDVNILRIKKLLDYFLKNNSNKYSETEREATRISYRKAFYMYIVLFIQQNQLKH
ncbi:hypothetical protein PBI_PBS1_242 [Bacillus phage PBS1]|uniref:Uncharacterized protein n=1 Tax=Bacillus phage PBS1 TaxID=2884423 RepID=A0A223LDE9_BPPB1|nr:hypothetical protein FK780_gp205 [Bacillus phage PBS1]ASU00064.1 hypothetical protein PBI_PBS1_242 [Bacillus phage PBS1]BDE75426.1 hypothetical protein [Bacillus phage PBS1]